MEEPLRRVRFDDIDEIGIYDNDGMLEIVFFDYQGGDGQVPRAEARAIGEALISIADEDDAT